MSNTNTNNTNATVNTNNAYFDLHEYVERTTSAEVAAEMASSIAFAIDVQLTSECRGILRTLRDLYVEEGQRVSELTDQLKQMAFAEQVMASAGHELDGAVTRIGVLSTQRDIWHDLAEQLVGMTFTWQGVPRVHRTLDIEDVLTKEVKLTVKPLQEHRIKSSVVRRAEALGAETNDVNEVIKRRLEREAAKAAEKSVALTQQGPALLSIYIAAVRSAPEVSRDFWELPANVRRSFIEAAKRGASRAEDFASASNSLSDHEFDVISFASIKVERELNAVLAGPAYRQAI